MRVTFVSPPAYSMLVPSGIEFAGGAELQQVTLARWLAGRGHEVAFVVGDFGQPPVMDVDGMKVHRSFRLHTGNRKLRFLPDMMKLRAAIHRSRPQLVNQRSTAFYTGQCCRFSHESGAAFSFSLGIDYNCHRDLMGRSPWPIQRLYAWGIAHADLVLAQTQEQQALMRRNFGRETEVLPNMLALPPPRSPGEPGAYVLWVGSLARRKQPELFVELARRLPYARFRLVGGPGEDRGYDDHIRELARGVSNLQLSGFVPPARMDELYRDAVLYVNTSRLEGLPNAFLQAWAHGVPAVTLGVDPDGVIAREGLGAVAGSPERLAAAVDELLSDPARRAQAGERGRAHVARRHDVEAVGPLAEAWFERAIARRQAATGGGRA